MNEDRKLREVIPASLISSVFTSVVTNPIEVLKLRSQTRALHVCSVQCWGATCLKGGFSRAAVVPLADYFRGALYSSKMLILGNLTFMYSYQQLFSAIRSAGAATPLASLISCLISRAFATTLTMPIESARISRSLKLGQRKFGFRGLKITLARDLMCSALYWPTIQMCRDALAGKDYRQSQPSMDKLFICNVLPATIAGMIIGLVTAPLDHLKTRVQSNLSLQQNVLRDTIKLLRQKRLQGLLPGLKLRVVKVGVHCPIFLLSYELMLSRFRANQL